MCRRFLNFIATCHSSDSELIRSVIKHAILCARVQSPVGRNYVMCYERYGFKVEDEFRSGLKSSRCSSEVSKQLSFIDCCHITLLKLKAGILYTPGCVWSRAQIDCMLTLLA